jgi:hypothetical protein
LEEVQATKILSSKSRLSLPKNLFSRSSSSKIPIQGVGPRFLEERRILMFIPFKIPFLENFST